ncbi:hypothetical protein MTR67_001507 [Solanum verrucosum]|uniref:Uncharacterized protein n=1 Tax=Solanum verrucosum TaxID=315347 RepID=A0AAF0T540_SOLVR|nr:hypothetical protein MTR67_001507 [Solanum verrucosum]
MMSKSHKHGGVGKISPRYFQPYQEILLNHPELGFMTV